MEPDYCENSYPEERCQLTREYSFQRATLVREVEYSLSFYISSDKASTFQSHVIITFTLLKQSNLKLDFAGKKIFALFVNGELLTGKYLRTIWDKNFIELPSEKLFVDKANILEIYAESLFSKSGNGFCYCKEKDSSVIIYSITPPNYSHQFYPCFDQPNIKANFTLSVICPTTWCVVSNEFEQEQFFLSAAKDYNFSPRFKMPFECKVWRFARTKVMSTYLFTVALGDLDYVEKVTDNGLRMRFYARSGRETSILSTQITELFNVASQSVKFYEDLFNVKYPFSKCDFIFLPEFIYVGMEHPGLIGLTDSYNFWSETNSNNKTRRAITICHEVAHMWFGNLVTMKWWDDIWLNEAFATWISHYCLDQIPSRASLNNANLRFLFYKEESMILDMEETTHPVAQDIPDTDQATTIFDTITYSKGSAILKQIFRIVGLDGFKMMTKRYFDKFKWGNADSSDLIEIMQSVMKELKSDLNVKEWYDEWLYTAGINSIEVIEENGRDGKAEELNLLFLQSPVVASQRKCRSHELDCGIYVVNKGELEVTTFPCRIKDEITRKQFPKPKTEYGIMLNEGDHGYCLVIIPQSSLEFFVKNYSLLGCLAKGQVFLFLFHSALELRLSPRRFIEFSCELISAETDGHLLYNILNYIKDYLQRLSEPYRQEYYNNIFNCLHTKLLSLISQTPQDFYYPMEEETTAELQKQETKNLLELKEATKDRLCDFAVSLEALGPMVDWFRGENKMLRQEAFSSVSRGSLFEMIFLHEYGTKEFRKLLVKNYIELSKYWTSFTEAADSDENQKKELWKSFCNPNSHNVPLMVLGYMMKGFNKPSLKVLGGKEYEFLFYAGLEQIALNVRNKEYFKTFFTKLFPHSEDYPLHINFLSKLIEGDVIEPDMKVLLKEKLSNIKKKQMLQEYCRKETNDLKSKGI